MKKNNPLSAWKLEHKIILWELRYYKLFYQRQKFIEKTGSNYRTVNAFNVASTKLFQMEFVGSENIAKYDSAAELNANEKNIKNINQQHFAFCKDLANYLQGMK